jgi:hypothetical protein
MSRIVLSTSLLALPLLACGGAEESTAIDLEVVTAALPATPIVTDLGYTVELTRVQLGATGIEFTIGGETHDGTVLGGPAPPHPGHAAGGEVTGELPGDFVLTFDDAPHALGTGTLLTGSYEGANLTLRQVAATELAGGDPLAGHTAHLIGTATRDAETIAFDALLDVDAGTQVVGAVFQHDLDGQTTGTIELELLPVDPFEADTAFDGIEFADLALTDDVALVRPGDDAHNRMRRALATHDHWAAVLR